MQCHVIDDRYPLRPHHIDTTHDQWGGFGDPITADSALWLVRYFQEQRKDWGAFTVAEVDKFFQEDSRNNGYTYSLHGLTQYLFSEKGIWWPTHEFVSRCFTASPNIQITTLRSN